MKKFLTTILTAVALFALPLAQAQSANNNVAYRGVSLLSSVPATVTQASGTMKLPTFSGVGTMTITESGITGSPSGCTVTLKYQGNNAATAGAVVSTTSFTPSTGTQVVTITPSTAMVGDNYVATYACTTYPTAGLLTISFSSIEVATVDPCFVYPKTTVSVAISTATTTQLVALAAGKTVYVCGVAVSIGATTTVQFEYGTGSACGTGTTALTGVFAPSTGSVLNISGEGTKISTIASNALCAVSTGTGGINGVVSYVQM